MIVKIKKILPTSIYFAKRHDCSHRHHCFSFIPDGFCHARIFSLLTNAPWAAVFHQETVLDIRQCAPMCLPTMCTPLSQQVTQSGQCSTKPQVSYRMSASDLNDDRLWQFVKFVADRQINLLCASFMDIICGKLIFTSHNTCLTWSMKNFLILMWHPSHIFIAFTETFSCNLIWFDQSDHQRLWLCLDKVLVSVSE